jgi:DJ-1/PfpI family
VRENEKCVNASETSWTVVQHFDRQMGRIPLWQDIAASASVTEGEFHMNQELSGKRVAILATEGFEQAELMEPRKALLQAGAKAEVISPMSGSIRGWGEKNWGEPVNVDVPLQQARPEDYDALVLPGGVMNPDKLRMNETAVKIVRAFFESGKPIAAICHGPWMAGGGGCGQRAPGDILAVVEDGFAERRCGVD